MESFDQGKLVIAVRMALAMGALITAGSAFAQDASGNTDASSKAAKSLETVVVTGSRIRSVDVATAQPVFTMTQADIKKTGLVNVGDILQNLTVIGEPTFSKAAVLTSNSEEGGQYANMRNLGTSRTLVLVNGKRWTSSLAGYTDMSTIPSALIERIDVLKDGASSIYGSDAIAGVINIILKSSYSGAETSAYVGQNEKGDGTQQAYSFTVGSTSDKTSVMFSANYTQEDAIWAKDRDITAYTYGPNHAEDGLSGTGPWGRFRSVNPITGAATGSTYTLNHTGTWNGQGVGQDSRNLADYHAGSNPATDYYNPAQQMNWTGSNEMKSIFTSASHTFNDYVTFKTNAMYSERDNDRQVAGYPLNSRSQPGFPVYLSGQSYYNPTPGKDLFFYRRTVEVPRGTNSEAKSYHWDADLEGALTLGTRNWNWDAGVNFNQYDTVLTETGNLNLLSLQQALGPSFLNSNGAVQCGTAAKPIGLNQCVPLNILGGPSASTPAMINYVMMTGLEKLQSQSREYFANVTGGLFDLPAGEVAVAAGYDYRQLSGYDRPDSMISSGYSTVPAVQPTTANYSINEFYAELNVPLLKDLPGAKQLALDISSRYSDYSSFGSTVNSKYSLTWKPIDDLLIRGTYAQGFRAPTLSDVFGGGTQTFDYYTDSCDRKFGATTDPKVAAACTAAGAGPGFRQTDINGKPVTAPSTQGSTPFIAGAGNAYLKPENSTTRTAGIVYSPSWVAGLDVSLDWYDIKITNAITALGATDVLNNCYVRNIQGFCNAFQRDPVTHQVINLYRGNVNEGLLSTAGYDFGAHYRLPEFGFGKFAIGLDANYLASYNQQATSNSQAFGSAGYYNQPRIRANLSLDWSNGNWGATWAMRYYGAFRDTCWSQYVPAQGGDPAEPAIECNQPNYAAKNWSGVGANRKGASVYDDAQIRYAFPWKGTFAFGVKNVFDKSPTITYSVDDSSTAKVDPALPIDRYFYVSYNQKF